VVNVLRKQKNSWLDTNETGERISVVTMPMLSGETRAPDQKGK